MSPPFLLLYTMALNGLKKIMEDLEAFNFEVSLSSIIAENKDLISDKVADQIGRTGLDGNGDRITLDGGEYTDFTVRYKQEHGKGLGAVTDRVTLYQTGELYRMIETEVTIDEVTTLSNVPYYDELMERTGEQVMKLNESSRLEFAQEIVIPAFAEDLKEKTGLKIN